MQVIIDMHNYGRYTNDSGDYSAGYTIGSPQVPTSSFADVWSRIATALHGRAGLGGYDLMNEPHDMIDDVNDWPNGAQAAINAIRAVDMNAVIYVEGNYWSSAERWATDNTRFPLSDPAGKVVYEAHQYFDFMGSGRYTQTYTQSGAYPTIGADRIQPFLTWLQQNNSRGYIGEFGAPNDDQDWRTVMKNFMDTLVANGIPGTVWAYSTPQAGQSTVQWPGDAGTLNVSPAAPGTPGLVMDLIAAHNRPVLATPTDFSGAALNTSSIQWSWKNNSTNATGYRILSGNTNLSGDLPPNATSWIQTGLASNTQYGPYLVQAFNSNTTANSGMATAVAGASSSTRIAINAGGGAVGSYAADAGFSGGTAVSNTSAVIDVSSTVNAAPQAALQSERFGNFTYTISGLTPSTTYHVRLHFVESVWTQAGRRVFNVTMNGATVLSNFDIFAAAGASNKAVIREFDLPASSSGSIAIQFATVLDNAEVNALEVATPIATSTPDTTAPSTPTGLLASAVSSSQINLSWTASTDNVGVTGYKIYRGATLLATLGAVNTYQNTGLTASTAYSYTVQAVDAAGNASAQSAAASATTLAAPDTQAPTVPAGLTAVALSPTQINLAWNTSTDNVAVTSYQVYLNNVLLTNTTTTSFQHTGLTPGTTYSYRVSAADAVPNYSAWTATPVSVTTPGRRAIRSDFDGNGKSDILWRNSVTGQNAIWFMNGAMILSNTIFSTVPGPDWSTAGVGDFDGDGKSDILWRNSATGQNAIWFMNGATISSAPIFATLTDSNWSIAGVGDFDGDGKSDILWRNSATGQNAIWFMNGATISSAPIFATLTDSNWSVAGVGDFDGDGKSDLLWRNSATGADAIMLMNGATISSSVTFAVTDSSWSIAGIGDFDGDGKSDILWRNSATGADAIMLMNGATTLSNTIFSTVPGPDWNIAGVGDFDGDGKSDILWRNGVTGENTIWLMNGTTIVAGTSMGVVGSAWSITLQ